MSDNSKVTKRVVCDKIEDLINKPIQVLDHGFIRVIDYMGDDSSIPQAARVSYGDGTKSVSSDRGLIRYLLKNQHTSPFEMCEIKLHIKAPIFVARQWVRHRTANINEYSGRYSVMSEDFYTPAESEIKIQSNDNKQGRSNQFSQDIARKIQDQIKSANQESYKLYTSLLNDYGNDEGDRGLARELARIVLPVSNYTEFYWKIDLHNLLHFLALRVHVHAQYEIRVYAQAILDIVKIWVPIVFEAFCDYKLNAERLSAPAIALIKDLLSDNKNINISDYKISKREILELKTTFDIDI